MRCALSCGVLDVLDTFQKFYPRTTTTTTHLRMLHFQKQSCFWFLRNLPISLLSIIHSFITYSLTQVFVTQLKMTKTALVPKGRQAQRNLVSFVMVAATWFVMNSDAERYMQEPTHSCMWV